MSRLLVTLIAGVMVVAGVVPGCASTSGTGDVLVSGRLVDQDGEAVAGAMIVLQVWPPHEVRAEWTEDEQFELDNIGTATTEQDGSYAVGVEPGTDLSIYQSEDGFIEIDVLGLTEEGLASCAFNIVPDDPMESDNPDVARVDFETGQVAASIQVDLRLHDETKGD